MVPTKWATWGLQRTWKGRDHKFDSENDAREENENDIREENDARSARNKNYWITNEKLSPESKEIISSHELKIRREDNCVELTKQEGC